MQFCQIYNNTNGYTLSIVDYIISVYKTITISRHVKACDIAKKQQSETFFEGLKNRLFYKGIVSTKGRATGATLTPRNDPAMMEK